VALGIVLYFFSGISLFFLYFLIKGAFTHYLSGVYPFLVPIYFVFALGLLFAILGGKRLSEGTKGWVLFSIGLYLGITDIIVSSIIIEIITKGGGDIAVCIGYCIAMFLVTTFLPIFLGIRRMLKKH
jgi:hypothetical protein